MKKTLLFILTLSLMIGLFMGTTVYGDTKTANLTPTELSMIQAFEKSMVTGSASYMNKYAYPGRTFKDTVIDPDITAAMIDSIYYKTVSTKTKTATLIVDGYLVTSNDKTGEFAIFRLSTGMDLKVKGKKAYLYAKTKNVIAEQIKFGQVAEADEDNVKAYLAEAGFPNTSSLTELTTSYNESVALFTEVNEACKANGLYDSNADVKAALDNANKALDSLATLIKSGKLTADEIDQCSITLYRKINATLVGIKDLY